MSSDFENALARAAAERSAQDEAKAQQERQRAEKVKLAHSIIDPYLAELGPTAAKALRELGVPTEGHYTRSGPAGGTDLGYWEFKCESDSEGWTKYIHLDTHGRFAPETYPNVGLVQEGWIDTRNDYGGAFLLADLDNRKVYVSHTSLNYAHNFDPSRLQELGEFLAQAIYGRKKA